MRYEFTSPNEKNYFTVPGKSFVVEYMEETDSCRKESEALTNPYGSNLPKLCALNCDENNCQELLQKTALFASVYLQWHVSPVPDPATVVNLKVGVKLCILYSSRISMKIKKLRDRARKNSRRGKKTH